MADILTGQGCSWTFEAGAVRMRFHRAMKVPKFLQELGERLIPYEALADVSLTPGKRGTVVLRAVPRQGADPVLIAAAGQLKEALDPYRLVLPADRESLADYYAEEIRRSITDSGPARRCLVQAPPTPRSFKGWDGQAHFDDETVRFQWFWSSAESVKYRAGDQRFAVSDIEGVEWRSPDVFDGYLRLRVRGLEAPKEPEKDPASVVFGMGYGLTAESLPFAAAVVGAIRDQHPAAELPPAEPAAEEPVVAAIDRGEDIPALIRKLGELRDAGLLTEEEFQAKKVELLSRL
ncbi:hypothetical protein C1I98_12505 [Spongiactinospora gelatinilytica]|uniref:DUF4429 domain-containing protein n=1 Tax=Spongiactinospora gelatinilytica TaxID=2666298 RepID=A0A2W2HQQ2_9ACTN|nr:DUF4429 domain-containing protein [Spongiactinospora gelatinilytica]PZG48277.1 hypothetical protein C1I98_12505 [Spongiactinospora gelatinilytica]